MKFKFYKNLYLFLNIWQIITPTTYRQQIQSHCQYLFRLHFYSTLQSDCSLMSLSNHTRVGLLEIEGLPNIAE